jgi:flagellar protein FlbD
MLTRLNDTKFALNDDAIEVMEERPDTTIRLTNGNIYIVKESVQEVTLLIIKYRRQIFADALKLANAK